LCFLWVLSVFRFDDDRCNLSSFPSLECPILISELARHPGFRRRCGNIGGYRGAFLSEAAYGYRSRSGTGLFDGCRFSGLTVFYHIDRFSGSLVQRNIRNGNNVDLSLGSCAGTVRFVAFQQIRACRVPLPWFGAKRDRGCSGKRMNTVNGLNPNFSNGGISCSHDDSGCRKSVWVVPGSTGSRRYGKLGTSDQGKECI
jgi:hypothetical protein